MNYLTLLAAAVVWISQESAEALIEKFASTDIDVRTRAVQDLLKLGAPAVPALKKAAQSSDPEIAVRAKQCLARIEVRERLTPALRRIDGLDVRLLEGGDRVWTELFLEALPWRASAGTAYAKLGATDLEALVEKAVAGARDDAQLIQVLGAARQYKLQRARPAAQAFLGDRPAPVRAAAAAFLLATARENVLECAEPLLKDRERAVREAAIHTLAELKVKAAVPLLVAMKEDASLAMPLGRALLQLGSREGTPLLLKLAALEPFDAHSTRSTATMYLGFYAGPEIIPQMRALLKWMQKDPNTADGALTHLGNWGDRDSIPLIERAVKEFRVWGNNPHNAVRALYFMGAGSSTATLLKLASEQDGGATRMLGRIGNPDAVPGLRALLANGNAVAATALAELNDRESIPSIRKLLVHRDHGHRAAACLALALLDDVESAEKIGAMEEAGVARRIWPALKALERADGAALPENEGQASPYSDSEYHPAILEGTNSTYGFPRYLSVRAAATVRAGRSAEMLVGRLGKQGNESHGLIAAAALCRMGRKEGVFSLLEEERLVFSLNAIRQPEAWARLEKTTTALNVYASYEKIHRALAQEAGLDVEGPPEKCDAHKAWVDVHQRFRKWGRPATLTEAFDMIEDDRWSIILEKDRIRILPRTEALLFWNDWLRRK